MLTQEEQLDEKDLIGNITKKTKTKTKKTKKE